MPVRQMTSRTLNALKGWPSPAAVDFEAKFSSNIDSGDLPVPPGAVLSLDASGEFVLGVGTTNVMPLFNFHASDDPTVSANGGDASVDVGVWVPINPTGVGMALPAAGAYELVSTHFKTDDVFAPNVPLTSPLNGADIGKVVVGVIGTDMIVGLVSRGLVDNGYGHSAVAFWPCLGFVYP